MKFNLTYKEVAFMDKDIEADTLEDAIKIMEDGYIGGFSPARGYTLILDDDDKEVKEINNF